MKITIHSHLFIEIENLEMQIFNNKKITDKCHGTEIALKMITYSY